jgi:hypothetical protein
MYQLSMGLIQVQPSDRFSVFSSKVFMYLPIKLGHEHRPGADVSHPVSSPSDFLGT